MLNRKSSLSSEESTDDSDAEDDLFVHTLRSSMGQEGYEKVKEKKPAKKRADMPDPKKKWMNARDRFAEQADDQMYELDLQKRPLFRLSPTKVVYGEDEQSANLMAKALLEAVEQQDSDYEIVGFDTEGKYDTVQLYTEIAKKRFAYLFQMSFIANKEKGTMPDKLRELFNSKKVVYVGKNVEQEILALLGRIDGR